MALMGDWRNNKDEEIELDGIGGVSILVKADVHRTGVFAHVSKKNSSLQMLTTSLQVLTSPPTHSRTRRKPRASQRWPNGQGTRSSDCQTTWSGTSTPTRRTEKTDLDAVLFRHEIWRRIVRKSRHIQSVHGRLLGLPAFQALPCHTASGLPFSLRPCFSLPFLRTASPANATDLLWHIKTLPGKGAPTLHLSLSVLALSS
jgi:hypothetical protein